MRLVLFFSVVLVFVLLLAAFAAGQTTPQTAPPNPPASTLPAAPSPASPTPTDSDAQDWGKVVQLDHDQPIHIFAVGGRTQSCLFTGATGSMLFCEPEYASRPGLEYRFSRADVQTVRLDQFHRNLRLAILIPAVAGATAGIIFGSLSSNDKSCPPVFCPIVVGIAGAGAGGLAGTVVALPVALLIPGKRVYHHNRHRYHLRFAPAPSVTP
ncbi:MAG TPA: hypothetical protein VFU55_08910 [Terracidiphilus sp.]|nr:hypothetical protein [Terracidiphilus sp.]